MFCKNCGKEIDDKAVVCPYCGVQTETLRAQSSKSNGLAVLGLVFAFLIPIVGLILSAIGRVNTTKGDTDYGLATAGIVISILWMILGLMFVILWFAL